MSTVSAEAIKPGDIVGRQKGEEAEKEERLKGKGRWKKAELEHERRIERVCNNLGLGPRP